MTELLWRGNLISYTRKGNNLFDGPPLSRGRGHAELFLDKVVGKPKPTIFLAPANHESYAIPHLEHLEVIGNGLDWQLELWRFRRKEDYAQHHVLVVNDALKRITFRQGRQFLNRENDHRDVMSESLVQTALELLRQRGRIFFVAVEYNVAAGGKASHVLNAR